MHHVLFLEGSPRIGNTSLITDWVVEGMGRTTRATRIRLMEKNIHECNECFGCAKCRTEAACRQGDDMVEIYDLMADADLVVWTSPVFCWSVSGVTKVALDRCFALLNGEGLLQDNRWALVLTAGGDPFDGADLVVQMFRRLAQYAGLKLVGEHVVAPCPDRRRLERRAEIRRAAVEFGRRLVRELAQG